MRAAPARTHHEIIDCIVTFLRSIGLEARPGVFSGRAFVPGIMLVRGAMVYDEVRLLYPGDLLHEAGHLAVKAPAERATATDTAGADGGEEMAAIAWSYAAALHIDLPIEVLFHAAGYRGGAPSLIESFRGGRYVGVPMLQWLGLAAEPARAQDLGVPPYPKMIRWLRQEPR